MRLSALGGRMGGKFNETVRGSYESKDGSFRRWLEAVPGIDVYYVGCHLHASLRKRRDR